MASGLRAAFSPPLVTGVCIMAFGVTLVLDRLGLARAEDILQFWPVALILFGLSLAVQASVPVTPLSAAGEPTDAGTWQDGPPGFRGMNRRYRHRSGSAGFIWLLILGALIFHGSRRDWLRDRDTGGDGVVTVASPKVDTVAIMTRDNRAAVSNAFRGGHMTAVMGGSTLDLRQAKVAPGEAAVIDVFALMGGVNLRVPPGWTVDVRAMPVMGAVRDRRPRAEPPASDTASPAPRIVLRGLVMMGGLDIRS